MSNYSAAIRSAAKYTAPYIRDYVQQRYPQAAAAVNQFLLQKTKPLTAAKAIQQTRLKSYLDRTYQRKCGVEVKELVTANSLAPTTTLAVGVIPFDDLTTGELATERTGDSIEIKDIKCKMILTNSSTTTPTFVRLMWVWCKNYNGSSVAVSQILNTTTNIMSFPTVNEGRGVQILRDKTIPLGVTTSDSSRKVINFGLSERKHFKGCKAVRWNNTDLTGDIAQMLEGYLALYVMAADATITSIVYYMNARFVDV